MLQGCAVQKLHSNERLLTVLADFVDGANIGMIESRGRPRLPAKPFQCLWVARQFIRQEFESHEAAKVGVLGFIDHTHTAAAEFLDNAVVRNGLADHEWVGTQDCYGRDAMQAKSTGGPTVTFAGDHGCCVADLDSAPQRNGKLSAFPGVSNEHYRAQ